jgi:hypothetical protein
MAIRLLFTNEEYQLAQRAWDRIGMDDPTIDLPIADEAEFGTDDAFPDPVNFPPLTCQCGEMSIESVTADELGREWARMDMRDHHIGRPCGTGLVTL